jgi:hypothetical protein
MTSAAACPLPRQTSSMSPTSATAEVINGEFDIEECCALCAAIQASA